MKCSFLLGALARVCSSYNHVLNGALYTLPFPSPLPPTKKKFYCRSSSMNDQENLVHRPVSDVTNMRLSLYRHLEKLSITCVMSGHKDLVWCVCHSDHWGGSGVCRAATLLDAGWGRQDLSTTGKIAVWMKKKKEQCMPAMLLIWNKEWARDPTVLQSCMVSQAAPSQAMTKLQFSQPSFTTYHTSAAVLL